MSLSTWGLRWTPRRNCFSLSKATHPVIGQIQPGRAGWRKVDMEAWTLQQPLTEYSRLMHPIVAEDEKDVYLRRV